MNVGINQNVETPETAIPVEVREYIKQRMRQETESAKSPVVCIMQKIGGTLPRVKIKGDAPTIQGFLAVEGYEVENSTMYIALDNIASFHVLNDDAREVKASFPKFRTEIVHP